MVVNLLAAAALAVWLYLIAGRGGFWLASERDDGGPAPATWPAVTAVIPARDEAEGVGDTIASLLQQDYPGVFSVILVDDQSTDGTAEVARRAAAAAADRLIVVPGTALPPGWTGKLWAMKQGVARALPGEPVYLLFTDADIVYDPDALTRLVSEAQAKGLVLNSLMARLRCESFAERAFVPAFIFFFQMLYPFAWVNRHDRAMAAAAGGCMLVRRDALDAAGGIEAIRGALIDDCALARSLKPQGPIRLSLTDARTQHPRLCDGAGYPPHGRALGLCAAWLFAAAARWQPSPAWRSSIWRPFFWLCSATALRRGSACSRGRSWRSRSSRSCGSTGCRRYGAPSCRRLLSPTWPLPSTPPINMPASAAAFGKAASSRT